MKFRAHGALENLNDELRLMKACWNGILIFVALAGDGRGPNTSTIHTKSWCWMHQVEVPLSKGFPSGVLVLGIQYLHSRSMDLDVTPNLCVGWRERKMKRRATVMVVSIC